MREQASIPVPTTTGCAVDGSYTPCPRRLSHPRTREFFWTCTRITTLLVSYTALERWLMHYGNLAPEYNRHNIILMAFCASLGPVWLTVIAAGLAWLVWRGGLTRTWQSLEHGLAIRTFIVLIASIQAWSYSTYSLNFYFSQGHYYDRVLLVAILPLIYWRPFFVFPFLCVLVPVIGQSRHPLGLFLWPIDGMLVRLLMMSFAAFAILVATNRRRTMEFAFLACCLVASNYWWPGLTKLKLNWITHGHLYFLVGNAYTNGWLTWLDEASAISLANWMKAVDWPARVFTLLLECGAIFILYRRATMLALIAGWVLFHAGVFVIMGYLFWKWIIVDIALGVLVCNAHRLQSWSVFRPSYLLLSIPIIATASVWFNPPPLAWYDTRLVQTYQIEAIGESGEAYMLPASYFGIYADQFTMGQFGFLAPGKHLVNPYGVTGVRSIADALLEAGTPEEIKALEDANGSVRYDAGRASSFYAFLREYISSANRRGSPGPWFTRLGPPRFLLNSPWGRAYAWQEKIQSVRVYRSATLFNGRKLMLIKKELLGAVDVRGTQADRRPPL